MPGSLRPESTTGTYSTSVVFAQDALAQEALAQDAELHEAFESAVEYHVSASKAYVPVAMDTNWSSPAFGFGVPEAFSAAEPLTTPTPIAPLEP